MLCLANDHLYLQNVHEGRGNNNQANPLQLAGYEHDGIKINTGHCVWEFTTVQEGTTDEDKLHCFLKTQSTSSFNKQMCDAI